AGAYVVGLQGRAPLLPAHQQQRRIERAPLGDVVAMHYVVLGVAVPYAERPECFRLCFRILLGLVLDQAQAHRSSFSISTTTMAPMPTRCRSIVVMPS